MNRFEEPTAAKMSLKKRLLLTKIGYVLIANKAGWYWYQAPIETQALLIEAFTEVSNINQ
jgi:hypothetical protein